MTFFEFFYELVAFATSSFVGTESNFDNVVEADFFECAVEAFESCVELRKDSRSYHCHDFLVRIFDCFEDVEYLRNFEDSTEWASVYAFTAIDTFAFVNVLYAIFVFRDSFYRASFFARYRHVDDSVVRTALVTDTARDTYVVVDFSLSVRFEVNCVFRAVHVAATSYATTAEVRDFVVGLYA